MLVTPLVLGLSAFAAELGSVEALREALASAAPGDELVLSPGTYVVDSPLDLAVSGTEEQPIVLRADVPGTVELQIDTVEGLRIYGAHWTIRGLDFAGICASDTTCEHALHLAGDADGVVVEDCVLRDFNAQIKSNGLDGAFPDDVVVRGNDFFNSRIRDTANPVVAIDVVGGDRWRVEANVIRDIAKGGGNQISYAAFLKGNGRDGVFARNLVICEDAHAGSIRLGLSLGGGGSFPDSICQDGTCAIEHTGGRIENNIIRDCPADVGLYLNAAAETVVSFNLVSGSTGIDVRFSSSTATFEGNVVEGAVRERDGGVAQLGDDWLSVASLDGVYVDPADGDYRVLDSTPLLTRASPPVLDFCGVERVGSPLLGPMGEGSDCDTRLAHAVGEDPDTTSGSTGTTPGSGGGSTDTSGDGASGSTSGGSGTGGGDGAGWPGLTDEDADPASSEDAVVEECGCSTLPGGATGALALMLSLVATRRRR